MKNSSCKSLMCEGPDRVGKSTQTKLLVKYLQNNGKRIAYVKSPYNDRLTYPIIYWMLRNGLARKFQNIFQIIQFINKLSFQLFVLPRLLQNNEFIILDRWTWSMYAYGISDGANKWFTEKMVNFIRKPDYVLLFDGEPHITTAGDSYENDVEYQRSVRKFYYYMAVTATLKKAKSVKIINANRPVQAVHNDVLEYFNEIKVK